jgi:hypothetical protein
VRGPNQHEPYQFGAGPTELELDEYECRLPSGEVSASEPETKIMRLVKKSCRAVQNRHEAAAIAMTDSCDAIGQLHCRDLSGKFEFGLAPQQSPNQDLLDPCRHPIRTYFLR